jgi:hypothetical protein
MNWNMLSHCDRLPHPSNKSNYIGIDLRLGDAAKRGTQ